ncbi:SanA/YdcF family protein [Cohnella luojiensis]|uniref:YdcF family protein n=1 Tax=Cohnella luojiensis TaxID=652876 RepID=A0A4Y8M633_9BACL|nr:YdcF family protein [Cohnella luojiensis]TFE30106.1 YdcF family protein [Cohnella luojiensis]
MRGFFHGRNGTAPSLHSSPRKRANWIRAILWLAALGIVALVIWCSTLYYLITHFKGKPNPGTTVSADVGIVLGATLLNNEPSPGLRERLDHGIDLYRSGAFKSFIVTGGLDNNGATLTEAEGMRNYLVEQGIPESSIVMDSLSRSTYENLSFAQEIMERNDWDAAVVVTHDYHGSRAADIAGKLGYKPVQVSVTRSKVLNMSYHETREILAYTKWLATKMFL